MRGQYSDILRTVERMRSCNLDRIDISHANDRAPRDHNRFTIPCWCAAYPVGCDT